ncbi:MAG: NAD(P)H-hydrate dehydratase [Gammaproteobacteria bacterium]|nr:MAG: NAD(P)H-hydrate dehydratase [Gammaproteobacteria bacterium]
MNLPAEIYSVESVRAIDQVAINDAGIGGYTLMTRAAEAALAEAQERFPDARRWQLICGGGNNGGDGYVLARLAAARGIGVSVLSMLSPDSLQGDAAIAFQDFAAEGGAAGTFEGSLDAEAELLVDAVLGSGLERDLEGRFAEVVDAINRHPASVLALDIPSGLNADSGRVMGVAVQADLTVTFVGLKSGLFLNEGPDYVGDLCFAGLDIPATCRSQEQAVLQRVDDDTIRTLLAPRKRDAHKGDFGHVLIVGGGPGMSGAVRLCGEAALRSGAGLVSVATHPSHHATIASGRPELMCQAVESADDVAPLLARATVIAIGPGLGSGEWSQSMFAAVTQSDLPMVVDADALNLLGQSDVRQPGWILTPHPGEAARLLDCSTGEVQGDRRGALANIAKRYGGTVVLKGSGSLVTAAAGPSWLCTAGNPGMAAPGMGDVLTGIIAALRAQGLSAEMAAVAGVNIHARAGDAAAASGQRGLMASDLLQELRHWVNP